MNINCLFTTLLYSRVSTIAKCLIVCRSLNTEYLWKLLYERDYVEEFNENNWNRKYILCHKLNKVFDKFKCAEELKLSRSMECYLAHKKPYNWSIKHTMKTLYDADSINIHLKDINVIPKEIEILVNCQILDLAWNKIKYISTEIGNLINLTTIDLEGNNINCVPTEIGNLVNLKFMNLTANDLEYLPTEISNLVNLRELDLTSNKLICIPSEIGELYNLEYLDLTDNKLICLPTEMLNLSNLEYLYFHENNLTHIPDLTLLKGCNMLWNKT